MNVHVHRSNYYDTGLANDVESGLGYWLLYKAEIETENK